MSERKSSGKDFIDELGDLLTENNLQVTFTGWKLELKKSEAKLKELQEKLSVALEAIELIADEEEHSSTLVKMKIAKEAFEKIKLT